MNLLLSLASSVVPILSISFVGILLLYKAYLKIRSKFNTTVNCWFCNQNVRVPYLEANSWTCPKCEQYNGFKDGDYNRDIFQQQNCSNLSGTGAAEAKEECTNNLNGSLTGSRLLPPNGFCDSCNEAQRLKVEKLAQFEPKNESHFNEELKVYKAQLEEQYRLCSTCDRHLYKVLREKKKMVLGSKFLDFIIRSAETLKQPHLKKIRSARQRCWKQRYSMCITVFTIFNIICLIGLLPALSRDALTKMLGETLGTQLFIVCSHVLALSKVISSYLQGIATLPIVIKAAIFFRTLIMMVLYSVGLKWPQLISFQLSSLYVMASPFLLLSCAFAYNVIDGFRLTRYTFLLVIWSFFAGGLVDDNLIFTKDLVLLLASFITLVLTATCRNGISTTKLHDNTANSSFHKIYSEDYFSDEDTLSMLSQHLNSSSCSVGSSMRSQHSYRTLSTSPQCRAPTFAANNCLSRSQLASPVPTLKTACIDNNRSRMHSPYAASTCSFATAQGGTVQPRSALHTSNLELSNRNNILQQLNYNGFNISANNYTFLESQSAQQSLNTTHGTFATAASHTAPGSPFSLSSSDLVYPHQKRTNGFISPSRFRTTVGFANNAPASSSWLSGGYFNQRAPLVLSQNDGLGRAHLLGHRNGMTTIEENLSRASSHSSGFESQNEHLTNRSRENSLCREAPPDHAISFQPIDSACSGAPLSPRSSSLLTTDSPSTVVRPLSVNCAGLHLQNDNSWLSTSAMRGGVGLSASLDSFNLRKINEELPTITRDDLLRKWKEGQALL